MDFPKVYVVVPTFRETKAVAQLRDCFRTVEYANWEVVIVNSNPGDTTSALLAADSMEGRFRELSGDPSLYWTGTVNIGLEWVKDRTEESDLVMLMNVDVSFSEDIISKLVQETIQHPHCQLGALAYGGRKAISSGVQVRSWLFARNFHPLAGWDLSEIPATHREEVDFMPTRCVIFPAQALKEVGLPAARQLPHYCADYEYTNRLRKHGYKALLCAAIRIESDVANTGHDIYIEHTNFIQRLKRMTDIKSLYNPRDRFHYVCLAYPWYAVPSALMIYWCKTLLEILLGGACLRRLLPGRNRSFSQ